MADIATLSIAVDSRDISRADGEMQKMGKTGEWLEKMILKAAAAFAAFKTAEMVKDAALLSARYETLGVVMQQMGLNAGYSNAQMRDFQEGLEKTGISMIGARNSLNMMSAAQLDLAKSSQLARVAQDAAVISGTNSTEAFETLVRSVQTGQVILAHHAGIMVNFERSYQTAARAVGKTAEQLSEHEKSQVRLNAILQAGAARAGVYEAAMGTAGKQILSMDRYVQNLEEKLGEAFRPALSIAVQNITESLKGMNEWMDKAAKNGSLSRVANGLGSIVSGGFGALDGTAQMIIKHQEGIKTALLATGATAAFVYGNQLLAGATAVIAPMAQQLALTVALELGTIQYASGVTAATIAQYAWNGSMAIGSGAMAVMGSSMGMLTIGLAALYAGLRPVMKETEALNEQIERSERFKQSVQDPILAEMEQAKSMKKMREAMLADGSSSGGLKTRAAQIQDEYKRLTKGMDDLINPQWDASAKMYATRLVDERTKLEETRTALEKKAQAQQASAEAAKQHAKAVQDFVKALDQELATYGMSEAQKQRYQVHQLRLTGSTREHALAVIAQKEGLIEETQAFKAVNDEIKKQLDGYRSLVDQLDPVASQAKKYADAVGLINTYTEGATEKTRLLKMAYDALTPSGIKAAEATRKLVDDAQRVKEAIQTPSERFGTEKGSLDAMLGKNLINVETYRRALIQLEAQQNTMWTNMGDVVTQYSDRASESMANFFNGTKTGFSDMISSMLLDMEKMIIKQQLMQPLMNGLSAGLGTMGDGGGWASWADAFGAAWGGAHADGGNVYGGQINLVGERGPELFVPHTSGSIIPNSALGGQQIVNQINVTVQSDGSASTNTSSSAAQGSAIAKSLEEAMNTWAIKNLRSGGILSMNPR